MKKLSVLIIILSIILLSCKKEEQECPCDNNPNPEKVYNGSLWNPSIEELEEFRSEEYTIVTGDIYLGFVDYLTELKYFENLTEIHGYLCIQSLPITSLDGLNHLKMISGELDLYNLDIENLLPLSNVEYFGSMVSLRDMPLKDLNGLQNLKMLQNLEIVDSDLESLNGLNALEEFSNSLTISNCNQLLNLKGLSNLKSIRKVAINNNANLSSLGCFQNVNSIYGLRLFGNPILSEISDLQNLEIINGDCILYGLPINNFNGLSGLKTVNGELFVSENPNLSSFIQNIKLSKIGGGLRIINNESLVDLSGLEAIDSLGGCYIAGNKNLLSLDGINPSISYSENIVILANENLSDFCALSEFMIRQDSNYAYSILNNKYNPSYQDFIDGNCSE